MNRSQAKKLLDELVREVQIISSIRGRARSSKDVVRRNEIISQILAEFPDDSSPSGYVPNFIIPEEVKQKLPCNKRRIKYGRT